MELPLLLVLGWGGAGVLPGVTALATSLPRPQLLMLLLLWGLWLWLLWGLLLQASSFSLLFPPGRDGSTPPLSASFPFLLSFLQSLQLVEVGPGLVWGQVQECGWWAGVVQGQVWVLEAGPW